MTNPVTRRARVERKTKESDIVVELDLDGTGRTDISTGVPFYDHMLNSLGSHASFDLTVHAWDLGTAIGYAEPLPDELVGYVYERVSGHGDLSGSGLFGKPVDVPDDAPTIDKLVAATGRRPR